MGSKSTPPVTSKDQPGSPPKDRGRDETPFEAVASICSVLVVGLFILTFIAQNMVIPSGSMKNTLLIGDHLMVDRITLAPRTTWFPLEHARAPKRGDIVVFIKPVPDDVNGTPKYQNLVKRLIGVPGDRIHLRNGIVILNGVAQSEPHADPTTPENYRDYIDDFPRVPMTMDLGATPSWSVDLHNHIDGNDLVVPPGMYFMMGDNRHNSADSRFWGFVPQENIVGRPLFNYWSFKAADGQPAQTGLGNQIAWMGHVALHFFTDTRWGRTLHVVR